jgi:hypothetical protein
MMHDIVYGGDTAHIRPYTVVIFEGGSALSLTINPGAAANIDLCGKSIFYDRTTKHVLV